MIVCPRCGKENQDHYKFCLGCGAELPRDAAHAPKSFTAPTPPAQGGAPAGVMPAGMSPGGMAPMGGPMPMAAPMPAARPMAQPAAPAMQPASGMMPMPAAPAAGGGDTTACSNCSAINNKNFKFCGTCGTTLGGSAPAMPAVQQPPTAAPAASGGRRGSLVLIRPDGSEGDTFPLTEITAVGRETGGLFASDSYLSPRHATLTFGPGGLTVKDERSLNGVYIRIAADVATELVDGAIFRVGQEIIRFERLRNQPMRDGVEAMGSPSAGLVGRICLVVGRETTGNCYPIPAGGLHLGRERGDILFPEDGYVSGLHCRLHEEGGKMMLTDVGSSNGTFVRLAGSRQVPAGSLILMGQQLFRVEY